MIGRIMTNVILSVVTIVWVLNFAARFFLVDYEPSPTVDGIFGAIVGGAFAIGRFSRNNDDDEDANDEEKPKPNKSPREDDGTDSAGSWY